MRFMVIGVRKGKREILARGVSTLDVGYVLLSKCTEWDHFEISLDSTYEVPYERT